MTCCGRIIEITDSSDPLPNFLCQECGKQGPQSAFPDSVAELLQPPTRTQRLRWWLAERLDALAARVAPK